MGAPVNSELTRSMTNVWQRIAAPLPPAAISWRQDGRASARQGQWFARFVAYIDAQFVQERLDQCVPGQWQLDVATFAEVSFPEPGMPAATPDREFYVKATLTILGVARSCIGAGSDYKNASTDAFKRAAVRFGIGAELYDYGQNWVQVDGDSKFAKVLEDPADAYARRRTKSAQQGGETSGHATPTGGYTPAPSGASRDPLTGATDVPACPKCGGAMWDNRTSKRNPKAPDFKCRKKTECDGAIWLDAKTARVAQGLVDDSEFPPALEDDQDDLPF